MRMRHSGFGRRLVVSGVIGASALGLVATAAPAALAQETRQVRTEIGNVHFGECLEPNLDGSVSLAGCGDPLQVWIVSPYRPGPIRSAVTGQCLADVDTEHPWGDARLERCDGNPRQIWLLRGSDKHIVNLGTGRHLKANDEEVVYVGDAEAYYPEWDVTPA